MNQERRLIGLTGGIATGKSSVSDYLSQTYQLPILDADIYAKEAVQLGSPILERIIARYSRAILQDNGELDRGKLGEIIFQNAAEKSWLEFQIHPYVGNCFQKALMNCQDPLMVLSIPLLFEVNLTHLVTEIWVVYCSPEQQKQRLMERNTLTYEQAIARIQNQLPLSEKILKANVVLDNSGDLTWLYQQIDRALFPERFSSRSK